MMKKLAVCFPIILISIFATAALGSQIGNSDVGMWYLYPAGEGLNMYPNAMAKITFNRETGDYVLTSHGIRSGMEFQLRSGGAVDQSTKEYRVAYEKRGQGNDFLIKGNFYNEIYGFTCYNLGPGFSLVVSEDGNQWTDVLRSPQGDSPREFCFAY